MDSEPIDCTDPDGHTVVVLCNARCCVRCGNGCGVELCSWCLDGVALSRDDVYAHEVACAVYLQWQAERDTYLVNRERQSEDERD